MDRPSQETRLELFDLESSLPLLERFVEFVPDAVIGVREGGMIAFANAHAARMFGYSGSEIVGRSVESLIPERFRGIHQLQRALYHETPRMRPMGGAEVELRGLRADGTEFPVDISLSTIESARSTLVLSFIRDRSEG